MTRPRTLMLATRLSYTQALSVELIYRFPLLQSFLSVAIGLVGLVYFWVAASHGAGALQSYSSSSLIAYFLVSSGLGIIGEYHLSANLSTAIRMGKLSASLLRPYPYLLSVLSQAAAHATVRAAIVVPMIGALCYYLGRHEAVSLDPDLVAHLSLDTAAILLALLAGWLSRMAIGLLAFDMTQTWGPDLVFLSFYFAASGIAYPSDLLSGSLLNLISWTPVYYMVGFPTLIIIGRLSVMAALSGLCRGLLVSLGTAVIVRFMWQRGMRKFEAIGL